MRGTSHRRGGGSPSDHGVRPGGGGSPTTTTTTRSRRARPKNCEEAHFDKIPYVIVYVSVFTVVFQCCEICVLSFLGFVQFHENISSVYVRLGVVRSHLDGLLQELQKEEGLIAHFVSLMVTKFEVSSFLPFHLHIVLISLCPQPSP